MAGLIPPIPSHSVPFHPIPPNPQSAMPRDAPAFDFYPERWLSGVAVFSDAEQIAYLRLLCHQWLNEALPDNPAALKRLGGKGVTPQLLAKFPAGSDGLRRNPRLEVIRTEQRERIARASDKARKMALTKWEKERLRALEKPSPNTAQPSATQPSGQPDAPHEPSPDDAQALLEQSSSISPALPEPSQNHAPALLEQSSSTSPALPEGCPPPTTHRTESKEKESAGAGTSEATGTSQAASTGPWPTVAEVIAYGETLLAPRECCEFFWHEQEQLGWRYKGQPIYDWRPGLRNFATHWKAGAARRATAGNRPRHPAYDAKAATSGKTPEQILDF